MAPEPAFRSAPARGDADAQRWRPPESHEPASGSQRAEQGQGMDAGFDRGLVPLRLRDLRDDQLMSLPDAATYLGAITGRKPHVSTLWRWCQKGCRGVRLESICIGGKRFVTAAAIERFVEALTASGAGRPEPPPPREEPASPATGMRAHVMRHGARRRQEIEVARRRLDEITGTTKPSAPITRSV